MSAEIEERIRALLAGRPVEVVKHAPIAGAEDAAAIRGTPLGIGGKAIVMKLGRIGFAVVAIGGDRRLDGALLRRGLRVQRYRFATADELRDLTGLAPGAVPPFGRPVFDLPLLVDADLAAGERIAFTVGRPDRSFVTSTADWLAAACPDQVLPLTVRPPG